MVLWTFRTFPGIQWFILYTLNNDTFKKLFGKKEEDKKNKDNKGKEENEDEETEEETEEQNNNSNMRKRRRKLLSIQTVTWLSNCLGVSA